MDLQDKKVLIIGTGPTGIAAALRLRELGHTNFLLLEQNDYVGGLSSSFTDEQGFTWDLGGHVLFSQYDSFNQAVDRYLGLDVLEHERKAWIRVSDTWVPYPFQENFVHLPRQQAVECFEGLSQAGQSNNKDRNFAEWIQDQLGSGIGKYFMTPYNQKVWQHALSDMSTGWINDRIVLPDIDRIMDRLNDGLYDFGWGQNAFYQYPQFGGMGELFERMAIPIVDKILFNNCVQEVDVVAKKVITTEGSEYGYDVLINTAPLTVFGASTGLGTTFHKSLGELSSNSVLVVGVAFGRKNESDRSWIYFPEKAYPFYRVSYLSHHSAANVPDSEKAFSLICELPWSAGAGRIDEKSIVDRVVDALVKAGVLFEPDREEVIASFVRKLDRAYPIPTLGRDKALDFMQRELEKKDIYSRGRFGAWKYEIGNMDHCWLQGQQIVDRLFGKGKEDIFAGC